MQLRYDLHIQNLLVSPYSALVIPFTPIAL